MPRKPARIIVLGRSKNRSKQLNNFLSEIFTQEIPAEFVSLLTFRYDDGSIREIDYVEQDIKIEKLNVLFGNKESDKYIDEIEIVVELDLIAKKLKGHTKKLLEKYFEEQLTNHTYLL